MTTKRLPHYIFLRGNIWWFRQRYHFKHQQQEIRLSLKTRNVKLARILAIKLSLFCKQFERTISQTNKMDNSLKQRLKDRLKQLIIEWHNEEISRWHDIDHTRSEGELNQKLEDIYYCISLAEDSIRGNHYQNIERNKAKAEFLLSEIPDGETIKNTLTQEDYREIARYIDLARIESLKKTEGYFLKPSLEDESPINPLIEMTEKPEEPVEKIKISEAIELFIEDRKRGDLTKKSEQRYRLALSILSSFCGDIYIHKITTKTGRELRDYLPFHSTKITTKELMAHPIEFLREKYKNNRPISIVTAEDHRQKILLFLNWLIAQGYIEDKKILSEPLRKPTKNHLKDRVPITIEQAKTVFSTPFYTQHKGFKMKKIQHSHHFWIPIIALHTGMRPNEICQLYINDIVKAGSIYYVEIDDKFDNQRLKTPNARRRIPIHSNLIKLGFINFVNDMKKFHKNKNHRLFNMITSNKENISEKMGEWYRTHFRDKIGVPAEITLYSYRHLFKDIISALNLSDDLQNRLMGHQNQSPYGSIFFDKVDVLYNHLEKITEFAEITRLVKPYGGLSDYYSLECK